MSSTGSDLIAQLEAASSGSFTDDAQRLRAITAAKAFIARQYTPIERLEDSLVSQVALPAVLKIFTDLDIFPTWQKRNGGEPVNAQTLAGWTGMSVPLMVRLMRHLATENVLEEVGDDRYAMLPFAIDLQSEDVRSWVYFASDLVVPVFATLPTFLANTQYKEPTDPRNAPFHFAYDCVGADIFEWIHARPRIAATFHAAIGSYAFRRPSWLDFFPVEQQLIAGSDTDGPFLVDVGGNVGHDIQKLLDRFPNLRGRLVLQDRPEVIAKAVCDSSIQRMDYDFFLSQPIKGARVYYLHNILHDWATNQAQQILENLKLAMVAGYSKILLNENVVTPRHPPPQMIMSDMMMLTLGSWERTEAVWKELINSAGLHIRKIWTSPIARESIIEVELE